MTKPVSAILVAMLGLQLIAAASAAMICPTHPQTRVQLTCGWNCCESLEGPNHGYYCCGPDDKEGGKVVGTKVDLNRGSSDVDSKARPERYATYTTAFQ